MVGKVGAISFRKHYILFIVLYSFLLMFYGNLTQLLIYPCVAPVYKKALEATISCDQLVLLFHDRQIWVNSYTCFSCLF